MNWRNRIGIYGGYLCGMAGIGFTLPFLPLYLGQQGLSDRAIGWISTCAALSGLAQFPIGMWSDRIGARKPFLLVALGLLTVSAALLEGVHGIVWAGLLVVLFAENGICRAIVDSLCGAEVTSLAARNETGSALGRLRVWKPIGIIGVALFGSWWGAQFGVAAILAPVTVIHGLGFLAAALIHEPRDHRAGSIRPARSETFEPAVRSSVFSDGRLWMFVAAMVLFHAANAPGGVYLGLYLTRNMQAPESLLAYAFVVSMLGWMMIVWPSGRIADRWGRRPLLILAWAIMALRLLIVALATSPSQIVANQFLDGVANGLFSVVAATWVTDRMADPRRAGTAQALVGTSLVLGSAIGPAISAMLVDQLGYRGLFAGLAGVGAVATAVVILFIPETLRREPLPHQEPRAVPTHAGAEVNLTAAR